MSTGGGVVPDGAGGEGAGGDGGCGRNGGYAGAAFTCGGPTGASMGVGFRKVSGCPQECSTRQPFAHGNLMNGLE